MAAEKSSNRSPTESVRVFARLPEDKRAELERAAKLVEEEFADRMKPVSPSRVALAKLKLARLRAGISLGEVAEKAGIDRGNLSKLENNADNVEINTLARLADALGYEIVVDLRKRS
jgi:DNA-binding Xre family transcriptional regulator